MNLASAFTLSRLSADLIYDLNRSPEVPQDVTAQCALSRGKIMVLLESPKADEVPADHVFAQVETLIRQRLDIDGLPVEAQPLITTGKPVPIKVYLKQQDLPKPSAVHQFNWLMRDSADALHGMALNDQDLEPFLNSHPEVAPDSLFDPVDDDDDDVTLELVSEEFLSEEPVPEALMPEEFLSEELAAEDLPDGLAVEDLAADDLIAEDRASGRDYLLGEDLDPVEDVFSREEPSVDELLNLDGLYDSSEDDQMGESIAFGDDEDDFDDEGRGNRAGLIAAGIGLAAVCGTLGYGLSRPCVIGGCDRIERSQALGDAALIALRENPTPQTVIDMGDQLNTAVNTLKPIPRWSPHRNQAQELLADYQGEADLLNAVAEAQQTAFQAAKDSQNPPHPISHWQGIAKTWRDTIAQLESIPAGSPIHTAFVAPKLAEYKTNLATIEGRISSEKSAEENLNQAQLTASLAKDQAEIANTLPAWKTALDSWDKAVKQLKQIPQGTLPYGDAQQLKPQFEADLADVRARYQQEQAADQFYNEAIRHAATARQYEAEEQWTLAMLSWRDAITQVKGIPSGASRYGDSQNLLKTYEPALDKAQENLRLALRFRKAQENFGRICNPKFCDFGLKGGTVQLALAKDYDALVDFSISDPSARAGVTVPASDQMINEVNKLLQEVINIGKRTQLPIELYSAKGEFIARFSPELEGYVKNVVVDPS